MKPRTHSPTAPRAARILSLCLLCLLPWIGAEPLLADVPGEGAPSPGTLKVHAYTLQHREAADVVTWIRPLLSLRGTVEEQTGSNTLVLRDTVASLERIKKTLAELDRPPRNLRIDIQVVQAGPKRRSVISPPSAPAEPTVADLSEDLESRLRNLLRYEDYRVLAHAGVSSKEGDEVTYSLGERYDVSFKIGSILAGRRLKLESFKIVKKTPATNKGRRVPPRRLFGSTLNLWLEQPFALVLAEDDSRQEALMVAISCYLEEAPAESGEQER